MISVDRPAGILPPSDAFSWPHLDMYFGKLARYLAECMARHIHYGLGAKADQGGRALAAFPPTYGEIDCSGWVRAALAFSAGVFIPDGSVLQHEWIAHEGFKISSFGALLEHDNALRIAFIAPNWQHPIGHVYLCRNGRTMESWGGHGPGSRSPLVHVLHAFTTNVYVLTPPEPDSEYRAHGGNI